MSCGTHFEPATRIWSGPPEDFDTSRPIGTVLLDGLRRRADRPIQIHHPSGLMMTGHQMYRKSVRLAEELRQRLGIAAGDRVTMHLQNEPDTAPLVVALFALGAVVNVLDEQNLVGADGSYSFLKMVQPKFIICHAPLVGQVQEHMHRAQLVSTQLITFEQCQGTDYLSVAELLGNDVESAADDYFTAAKLADITENTVAIILASSGTTGTPKAIRLSHAQLLSQIHRCTLNIDVGVMFNPSPLDWISGFDTFLGSIVRGKVRITCPLPVRTAQMIEIIERHQVTDTFCDPSRMYEMDRVLHALGRRLDGVQLLVCSGTLVPEDLQLRILNCFPKACVAVGYGLTEIGGLASASIMGVRGCSVGLLLRGMHIRIRNGYGDLVGVDLIGEIQIKTEHRFLAKICTTLDDRSSSIVSEWLATGDQGYFDADGHLFIVGRTGDELYYKQHTLRPIDIESVLERHPTIRRSVVVGVSVPVLNDIPAAICLRQPKDNDAIDNADDLRRSVDDLHDWLNQRLPSDAHRLRAGIYFVDELPITANGKIRRIVCKALALRFYHERNDRGICYDAIKD